VHPGIFKAYDVRGIYPDEIDGEAARAVGRGTARLLGPGAVVVGWDMRESAAELREGLVAGLRAEGADVIEIGRVATPMVYFATAALQACGGVMITASHNPGRYNGFKICGANAIPIGIETGLADIRVQAEALIDEVLPEPSGERRGENISAAYFDSLLSLFRARPRLKVAIDCGNGIAGEAIAGLLERLPLDVTELYFEPDGRFPNHEANPLLPENLEDLRRAVTEVGADLGIAFDGDGDRAVFIDSQGAAVPADLMTALLSGFVLEQGLLGAQQGSRMVYDLRSSRVVAETVRAGGGEPLRCRVGHAFMKEKMRQTDACFGGELSGHYYFRLPPGYCADDGAAAMLLVLELLEHSGKPLSELWAPLVRYSQSGEVNSRVADVAETLARLKQAFATGEADTLDGLTVSFDDWWFNVRPSNTEPLLRLNVEANSEAEMAAHRDRILAVITP